MKDQNPTNEQSDQNDPHANAFGQSSSDIKDTALAQSLHDEQSTEGEQQNDNQQMAGEKSGAGLAQNNEQEK